MKHTTQYISTFGKIKKRGFKVCYKKNGAIKNNILKQEDNIERMKQAGYENESRNKGEGQKKERFE